MRPQITIGAARATDIEQWSQGVAGNLQAMSKQINNLTRWQAEMNHQRQIDAQIEALRQLFDRAQGQSVNYSNIIILGGYAGFFALWNMVDKGLSPWLHAGAGLLIGISLVLFVSWETFKMIWSSVEYSCAQKRLSASPTPAEWNALQEDLASHRRRVNRVWLFFLIPTVAFGFAAGAALISSFAYQLVHSLSA